jgi:lipopolysaccharide/colanic/teichoic acid biosynthesis glycosyltransferase
MIRFFDFIFSLLGLIILSPILLMIGLFIKINSKGAAIYKQKRIGKGGKEFLLIKFRTMYADADKRGLLITVGGRDPRITGIGYVLRKFKLDELPQLWNVLIGEMSLVGPRPEVKKYVDLYTPGQRQVLNVRPGITDMASILFKDENTLLGQQEDPEKFYIDYVMGEKIKHNMGFIRNPSLKNYFRIIFLTIKHIIVHRQ